MTNNVMIRGLLLLSALALTACPSGKKCATNADCAAGQVCSPMSGTCVTGTGGGTGGGTGAGIGGGVSGGGGVTGGGTGGGGAGTGGGTGGGTNNGGETCQMPQVIMAGTLMGDTTAKTADYDPGCTGDTTPGPDAVYEISVPAGQRLAVSVVPGMLNGNQYDTAVYLIEAPASNCDPLADGGAVTCLGASDNPIDTSATESAEFFNTTGAAKTIYIIIDSYFDTDMPSTDGGIGSLSMGPFTMTTTLTTPPQDDTCAGPTTLTPGTPLTMQTLAGYGDDFNFNSVGMGCSFWGEADRVYSVMVPAGQRVTVDVSPEGASDLDLALNLVDGQAACGDTCVGNIDDGLAGDPETLRFVNRTGAAQAYLLIVDNYEGTGTFTLSAVLDTPPADEVCSGATPLVAGTPLNNQSTAGYSNDYVGGTNCGSGTLDGDRVYSVMVPNGQRGVVTITPLNPDGGTFAPSIAMVQGAAAQCEVMPRVCSANTSASELPHSAGYVNSTGMATNVFAIVDSSSSTGGNFNIAFTAAPLLTDDLCSTTTTNLMAGTRMDTLAGFFTDYTTGMACSPGSGADRLYRVQIPTNQRFTTTITPTADAGFDPVLNLVSGPATACDMMHACVAGADRGARNAPDTLVFSNFGAAFDGFLKVSDYYGFTPGTDYTLTTSLTAVPAGEACQLPQVVGAGMLLAQTNVGFSSDVVLNASSTCDGFNGRADRVYQVSVPAGQTLTVTVTPPASMDGGVGNQDVFVNVIDGPATNCADVMDCLGGADMGGNGAPETATYMNATAAAKVVFVQVVSIPEGTFNVNVQLQ